MYRLDNSFTRSRFTVMVVGCGGTGGFAAEGLCRLLPPATRLVLVDNDRVEESNLRRQNFYREDLGMFKAEALARRLARKFGRTVGYSLNPFSNNLLEHNTLVVGCVDNAMARTSISRAAALERSWCIDAGNADNWGQVLIGNAEASWLRGSFDVEKEVCRYLPLPILQQPALLVNDSSEPSCAQTVEQGPTINQAMAALVIEVVHRLIEGTCTWMQLYVNLEVGTLHPVPATPEAVERVTGIKRRKLITGKEVRYEDSDHPHWG